MEIFHIKQVLSAVAIVITFVAFVPYILTIIKGTTRPHVFSWAIWGMTTIVVFFAQLDARGGIGAWPIGVSGSITLLVAILAYAKKADITIKRLDWLFFGLALSSLPLWYFTSDPMWAVVILTSVDVLGFGPTLRKAYSFPRSESMSFFALFATRNFLVIMALENYSITTVLFPAVIAAACLSVMILVSYRRRLLST